MFAVLTAALLAFAPAPPVESSPKGPPPQFKFVTVNDQGAVMVQNIDTRLVPEVIQQQVVVNGKPQTEQVLRYRPVTVNSMQIVDLTRLKATKTNGKEIDKDDLPKLLKSGAMVAWSTDGKPVDPSYLSVLKDDVLVFVVSTPAAPAKDANLPK